MTLAPWIAAALGMALLLGWARTLARHARGGGEPRPHPVRLVALLVLQVACAALLYLALVPPTQPVPAGTLVVLTGGAAAVPAGAVGQHVVRLPEAPRGPASGSATERSPDLASALRRYPNTTQAHVLGDGLTPRDQDVPGLPPLVYAPPPLPRGLSALRAPRQVQTGARFVVHGQVQGVPGGRVELLDPAGVRVDTAEPDADGRFALRGLAAASGPALFGLRLRDADGTQLEAAPVAVVIGPAAARRLLLMAGAPGPEVKFLRRWARDAGVELRASIALGGGVQLGDAPPFDAATLAGYDLVVLDERALQSLAPQRFAALAAAVRDGLGLLVRITGPLHATTRARLRALGYRLVAAPLAAGVRLDAAMTPDRTTAMQAARTTPPTGDAVVAGDASTQASPAARMPALARRALRSEAPGSVVLLQDAAGEPLARMRNEGRGRTAVWLLAETWRLVLGGHGPRHAQLWSEALARVGRPAASMQPRFEPLSWAGTRTVLCGLPPVASVVAPDGGAATLHRDPRRADDCAAYWPLQPGWHVLRAGDRDWRFHVLATDALPGVQARALRDATVRLATRPAPLAAAGVRVAGALGPRWPWLLAWLLASGPCWWLERSRIGRRLASPAPAPASV